MNNKIKRIEEIISICPRAKVYADIGCDHGYVTQALLVHKLADFVYASDISSLCLDKTAKLAKKYNLTDKIKLYVSNGLESFSQEDIEKIDVCVIAGMGGKEIMSILLQNKQVKSFVLQPMKNVIELRNFLITHNYKIIKDYIFFSGDKYYNLISAEYGIDSLDELQMLFGKTNLSDPTEDFKRYLLQEKEKTIEILKNKSIIHKEIYLQKVKNTLNLIQKGESND